MEWLVKHHEAASQRAPIIAAVAEEVAELSYLCVTKERGKLLIT